ncbi:unnamed protein product [Phytomonas sp. Hart1]|nr:unnamed protein product [Phytomonas sp. Hart1]|eukprot:CCW67028.1 unnamed protein product [Phytomonas sp. isolate Hart1]
MPEHTLKPKLVLTKDEFEKHLQHLMLPRKTPVLTDPFPLCPSKKLPPAKIDGIVHHLYTQSIGIRSASIADLEARIYKTEGVKHKPLGQDEIELSVRRLFNDAVLSKRENLERSRAQYLFHYPCTEKKIPLKDLVQHMYLDRIEAKKKTVQMLYDKYIHSTETGAISEGPIVHN